MMLYHYIISIITVLCTYLILDGVWLGLIAKQSYRQEMQGLLRDEFPVLPWVAFYVIYASAMAHLVIVPHLQTSSVLPVAISGFVLGLAAYSAYNLTNYAILKGWPLSITLKDLAWGSVAGAIAASTAWYATRVILAKMS